MTGWSQEGVETVKDRDVLILELPYSLSHSRLKFGVVCGRRVAMVIDYYGTEHAQLKSLVDIAALVIKEQLIHVDQFNIIRYGKRPQQRTHSHLTMLQLLLWGHQLEGGAGRCVRQTH